MGLFYYWRKTKFLEHQTKIIDIEMKMNSEFRVKWPRGELGALPDDAEQNIRLDFLENKVNTMEEKYSQ